MKVEHIQISDIVVLQDLLQSYGQVNGARERGDGWVDEQNRIASLTRGDQHKTSQVIFDIGMMELQV